MHGAPRSKGRLPRQGRGEGFAAGWREDCSHPPGVRLSKTAKTFGFFRIEALQLLSVGIYPSLVWTKVEQTVLNLQGKLCWVWNPSPARLDEALGKKAGALGWQIMPR